MSNFHRRRVDIQSDICPLPSCWLCHRGPNFLVQFWYIFFPVTLWPSPWSSSNWLDHEWFALGSCLCHFLDMWPPLDLILVCCLFCWLHVYLPSNLFIPDLVHSGLFSSLSATTHFCCCQHCFSLLARVHWRTEVKTHMLVLIHISLRTNLFLLLLFLLLLGYICRGTGRPSTALLKEIILLVISTKVLLLLSTTWLNTFSWLVKNQVHVRCIALDRATVVELSNIVWKWRPVSPTVKYCIVN